MAVEPLWLTIEDFTDIHDGQLIASGGLHGVKDDNLVQSALASPKNLFVYEGQDDVPVLAINGFDLFVPDDEEDTPLLGQWVEQLVTEQLDEDQLYDRLEHFVQPVADWR